MPKKSTKKVSATHVSDDPDISQDDTMGYEAMDPDIRQLEEEQPRLEQLRKLRHRVEFLRKPIMVLPDSDIVSYAGSNVSDLQRRAEKVMSSLHLDSSDSYSSSSNVNKESTSRSRHRRKCSRGINDCIDI